MLTETVSARMEARHLGIVGAPRLAVRAVESILGPQSVGEKTAWFFFQGSCLPLRVVFESVPVI